MAMSADRFPTSIRVTGYGWDDARSAYKVQIGSHERTIAYAWVPDSQHGMNDDPCISDATEIGKRLCEGWNLLHAQASQ